MAARRACMLLLNAPTWIAQTPPLTDAIVCGVGAGGTFARATEVASIRRRSAQSMCCSHSAPAHLGGGEVLGSVACEFRPGEQQMLLVSAPGDLYPPPSLSLIYYIITLNSEKTKQQGLAGPLQLHYLADFRHLSRRQDASVQPPGCSCAANKRHNKLPTRHPAAAALPEADQAEPAPQQTGRHQAGFCHAENRDGDDLSSPSSRGNQGDSQDAR